MHLEFSIFIAPSQVCRSSLACQAIFLIFRTFALLLADFAILFIWYP